MARLFLLLDLVPALTGKVAEFSSNVTSEARRSALSALRDGRVRVLVASDAMARGMDVVGVTAVVSYDPPVFPKTYVHRAGRTARGGHGGVRCRPAAMKLCITIYDSSNVNCRYVLLPTSGDTLC